MFETCFHLYIVIQLDINADANENNLYENKNYLGFCICIGVYINIKLCMSEPLFKMFLKEYIIYNNDNQQCK